MLKTMPGFFFFSNNASEAVGKVIESIGNLSFQDTGWCNHNQQWLYKEYLTTEYLELVTDSMQYAMQRMAYEWHRKPLFVTEDVIKPKQTIMQKLTSALKRALSLDKQTLYKAGFINGGLDLSSEGRNAYINALFQNDGDHAKAVAEMVADAEEMLKEDE